LRMKFIWYKQYSVREYEQFYCREASLFITKCRYYKLSHINSNN